jgi:hypothetical protein
MEIPEKYSKYFEKLDIPSIITDSSLKIVWKNKATDTINFKIRNGCSLRYYVTKPQFSILKRMQPGETISLTFLLDEPTYGFAKKKDDCYIFRISRFNAAAQKRITEIFNARYSADSSVASVVPDENDILTGMSSKRMDRLAGIFEGLYESDLTRLEISVPLRNYARQATCALNGIEVVFQDSDSVVFADMNIHDMYMLLSAMSACIMSYAPDTNKILLKRRLENESTVISVECQKTGFAEMIKSVYSDTEKLDALCEYGSQYLNLRLISAICDHYGWEFNVEDNGESTALTLTISVIWNEKARLSLFTEDEDDDIIPLLLGPFRIN